MRSALWLFFVAAAPVFAQVTVQEYKVPPGHRVHDVWADAAPDGPVWISAQGSGHLGILDPKTGRIDFVPLGRGSAPHGVIADAEGAPWLTDGGQNAIVRVDPKTRAVKVWPLPEGSGYANLNTAIFDAKGMHWFTGQSGVYGRLHPKTGELKVFDAPRGRGPYGIHATPDGTVYYASLAGSFIGKINADDTTTVIEPPTNARARAGCGPIPRAIFGRRVELGQPESLRAEDRKVVGLGGAGRPAARLRGLRRRYRQGMGLRVERAGHAAL